MGSGEPLGLSDLIRFLISDFAASLSYSFLSRDEALAESLRPWVTSFCPIKYGYVDTKMSDKGVTLLLKYC